MEQTSSPPERLVSAGNGRGRKDGSFRKAAPFREKPEPASQHPSRGCFHGTQPADALSQKQEWGRARLERSILPLHHRPNNSRGLPREQTERLFFPRRNPRLHHLELQNLLQFPLQGLRGAGKQKPLRSIAREGFGKPNWKRPQPIPPPRESMRLLPHRSCDPAVFSVQLMTGCAIDSCQLSRKSQATIACEGAGV